MIRINKILLTFTILSLATSNYARADQACLLFLTDSEGLTFHGRDPNIGFGITLDRYFRSLKDNSGQAKYQVHTALVGGSNPYTWLQSTYENPFQMVTYDENATKRQVQASKDFPIPVPGIDAQMKHCDGHKQKVLVIEAGANMFGDGDDEHKGRNLLVPELLEKIKKNGFSCVWIGPPRVGVRALAPEKYDRTNAKLKHMIDRPGGCAYISSGDKTNPANLGAANQTEYHYDPIYGTQWANKVIPEINPLLKYPTIAGENFESNARYPSQINRTPSYTGVIDSHSPVKQNHLQGNGNQGHSDGQYVPAN